MVTLICRAAAARHQGVQMTEVYREVSVTTISGTGNISAESLRYLCRAASIASFVIMLGMAIHMLNAFYLEPTYLGFVDKARDYS